MDMVDMLCSLVKCAGWGVFVVTFRGLVLGVHRVVGLGDEVRWSVRGGMVRWLVW